MLTEIGNKRTKIVATIGPTSNNEATLRKMIRAGLDVARINFSHGDHAQHTATLALIRKLAEEEHAVIALMADLQGPKIRLGDLDPDPLPIKPGDELALTCRKAPDQSKRHLPLPHPEFIHDIKAGQRLLLDDGEIELRVKEHVQDDLICEVVVGDELKSRKGVTAPGAKLSLSAMTDKDRADVVFALEQNVDYIAMSFVRSAEDIRELRWLVRHMGGDVWIIAKIEKAEALVAFGEILEQADGIMVARGDLGVEIPAAEVPIHQKDIIRRCNRAGKPVITATQMLSSMESNPRPTRAEASDVANAIFDGTDAVMLSNETAIGKYPVEAVETMAAIARIAEGHLMESGNINLWRSVGEAGFGTISDAVSHSTTTLAQDLQAKIIVSSSWTGYTARRVARERPVTPILCITPNRSTYQRMALVWGVFPVLVEEFHTIDEMVGVGCKVALDLKLVNIGDTVVIIGGVPFGAGGQTNFVKVHRIGEASSREAK